MALARYANGRQQTAKTSCTLEYKRYKKNAWKTTKELDRHHTTRFEKHRRDLGSSAITCCQQRMLASTCGPMCLTRDELRSISHVIQPKHVIHVRKVYSKTFIRLMFCCSFTVDLLSYLIQTCSFLAYVLTDKS